MTEVAAVVGNYQGASVLPDCLASLGRQTLPPSEVTVVNVRNGGLGFLYNRGAELAEAPYVLLLNNDVALDPRCVEHLAAELDADEQRFAADPTQLDWAGTDVIHARTTLGRG